MSDPKYNSIDSDTFKLISQRVLPHFSHLLPVHLDIGVDYSAFKILPLGEGLINGTYLVASPEAKFVLQQLNTHVFPAPWELVNNSAIISNFLQSQSDKGLYTLAVIQPLPLSSGLLALDLGEQGFWRALSFIPQSTTLSRVDNVTQAAQVGATFGHFAANLSGINPYDVKEVITDFHNLPQRLSQLVTAVEINAYNRLEQCQSWVDLTLNQQGLLAELAQVEAKLPQRICHNDTKINNMLFSIIKSEPLAVIDLDTCMPGYLMYDFGDMVRAFCSPVAEDSPQLDQVQARTELILAAAKAYTNALQAVLTEDELQSLWLGVKVMTLMLAVRFLTDYLQGDLYFSITGPAHNLIRAANQFTLYSRLLDKDAWMKVAFANKEFEH
jgi:Ser/Thr protein kinase RdoA (MazF antagonist)